MRVFWTNTAVQHLLAIHAHIAQDAPRYGQRMVERLTERSEQIAAFPLSGRMVPEYEAPDVREVIERHASQLVEPHDVDERQPRHHARHEFRER